jgi:hypothetical protein
MLDRTVKGAMVLAGIVAAPGCDGAALTEPYDLDFDPARFVAGVDNRYFPLQPGTTLTYSGTTNEGVERIVTEVTSRGKVIQGVAATVVLDRAYLDGELIEETDDWFAQDAAGNVWYLGEATKEYEDGRVVSTDGSWEAGVDGAKPGIYMWAEPGEHLGTEYFQEYFPGEAMDKGKVVALHASVQVPAGTFTDCVETEDWNLLEPGAKERKFYCAGVGLVRETGLGSSEVVELTSVVRR